MALRYTSAPEINNFVICIESLSSFFLFLWVMYLFYVLKRQTLMSENKTCCRPFRDLARRIRGHRGGMPPETWTERERRGGEGCGGGGLVIEGEREEQEERAVRRLQRLDSQVDCIWHKAQRWKKSGQLAHCTQHTPCSSTHLTMLLATPPPCPPPQTPSTSLPVFALVLPLFTLSWGLLMGVSSTFPPGMFSPCPAGLAGPSEEQWSRV